ncbi:CFEM domain-containing protein [Boeremia exigua]|uniref:CFEM domain-containing protein n=1 Tax=Boeremia exigua TaxID=749465 RepID=UPI001E8E3381|nr:CFEM domain-containing protein [Boeremia exigua]KAH6644889.1 CFEM domain-containing protein [Boeremia exigua]
MKVALSLLVLSTATCGALAQSSAPSTGLDALPPCALTCLITEVSRSPCQLTDFSCTCTNAQVLGGVEACVLQSCSVKEGLTTKNITSTICNAQIRDKGGRLKAINIALAVLSNISVIIRLATKAAGHNPSYGFGLDDVCLMVATYVGMSNAIVIDRCTIPSGLGRDIWTLEFQTITNFVRYFYVVEILYFVELPFLKLSLLFFYLRIFPGSKVKQLLWGTIAFNVAFGIAFVIAGIFQCRPISHYWTYWDGVDTGGKCFNINALAWANAAISIAVDLWMLAIPLFQVAKLNMARKKKIAVSMMFLVGTFVTIVSILRLSSLVSFANSVNPTWDQWDVTHWSIVEINVGIICACMPTFRSLLAGVLPKVFGSSVGSSYQRQTDNRARTPLSPLADAKAKASVRLRESFSTKGNSTSYADSSMSRTKTQDDEVELVHFDAMNRERGNNPC